MTSVRVPVPWRIAGITTPFVLLIIIIIGEEWKNVIQIMLSYGCWGTPQAVH